MNDVNQIGMNYPALEDVLPLGMLDPHESAGSQNAVRTIRIFEKLIQDASLQNAHYARYALLQSFPRIDKTRKDQKPVPSIVDDVPDFIKQYTNALCPEWYGEFLSSLNDNELEVFLKNYVHAHETWGTPEGIATLARTMLECVTHYQIPIRVQELTSQERVIPEELYSRLGNIEQYSTINKDFVLGKKYLCRPQRYDIFIGPISIRTLEKFQEAGWAVESQASKKLYRLVEFAEPFYLHARFNIILETVGFILGKASLNKNRLGIVESETESKLDVLVG